MRRIASVVTASVATVTALAGCPSRKASKVAPGYSKQEPKVIPPEERDVDILFLIDNSDSMDEEQQSLTENFPRFIARLEEIEGGLPNVHIGIISSNVGAHPGIPGCTPADSDEGRLQFAFVNDDPRCADGTLSLDGKYIEDVVVNEETGERRRNYTGNLGDVFSCMARLGVGGCGFEGQLESIRQALTSPENEGFLREDAYLAIIIITDEDDCSASDQGLFDPTITAPDSTLGPLDSFRCFEFGVQCRPDGPRVPGDKTECVPRPDSPYMPDVQKYVDFVTGLKPRLDRIIVAGVIGYDQENPDEPVTVEKLQWMEHGETVERFSLVPACQVYELDEDGNETDEIESRATPGVRLRYFLEQFPETHSTIQTICQRDLRSALDRIAELLQKTLGNRFCLTSDVFIREATADVPPYDCSVSDVDATGRETVLPHCDRTDGDPSRVPCWFIRRNEAECAPAGEPFQELVVERGDTPASGYTNVIVQCAVH